MVVFPAQFANVTAYAGTGITLQYCKWAIPFSSDTPPQKTHN